MMPAAEMLNKILDFEPGQILEKGPETYYQCVDTACIFNMVCYIMPHYIHCITSHHIISHQTT